MNHIDLLTHVKVIRAAIPGREALVGFVGVVERIATHAGVTIYWVRMDEKINGNQDQAVHYACKLAWSLTVLAYWL